MAAKGIHLFDECAAECVHLPLLPLFYADDILLVYNCI